MNNLKIAYTLQKTFFFSFDHFILNNLLFVNN